MKNNDRPVGAQSSKKGCLAVTFGPPSLSELTEKVVCFVEKSIMIDKATEIKIFQVSRCTKFSKFQNGTRKFIGYQELNEK